MQNTITISYTSSDGTIISVNTITGDVYESAVQYLVSNGASNQELDVAFTRSKVNGIWIGTDNAVTVLTNSTGSPANTLNLTATAPFVWPLPGLGALSTLLSADVTKLFISNSSGSDAHVDIRIMLNI